MGILDEAIREHLELKRQHGADDSELKQLEDQAFGQAERPGAEEQPPGPEAGGVATDPAAEAPTEFMSQPDLDEAQPRDPAPPPRREMVDIQEGPPVESEETAPEAEAGEEEKKPATEEQPVAEEPSAAEHEAVPAPPEPGGHTTEERHAIADQPTEMYDVEESFAPPAPAPPDEELVAEEIGEPRLGPAEKLPSADEESDEELEDEDDFFDEQRLSDELDQALEAPIQDKPEDDSEPISEEHEVPRTDEHEVARTDEHEPISEEHTDLREPISEEQPVAERRGKDEEDVLEETPDFLEEAPEDDQLWFEQKPPKDFDFDD